MWKRLGKFVAKAVGHAILEEVKKKATRKDKGDGGRTGETLRTR